MRTLILMSDWNYVLWWRDGESGKGVDGDTLPISDVLKKELDDYCRWFSELFYDDSHAPILTVDKRLLDDRGVELWMRLQKELSGIYRVLFYSEELGTDFASLEEFTRARANG